MSQLYRRKISCFVEELKEAELRSRRGKFICNHVFILFFFLPDQPTFTRRRVIGNETFYGDGLKENTESETFCMEGNSENYTTVV